MASGMAPGAVEAILAHEFAHIRRWDRWINLLQRLVEALLFFHPVVWWLSKRISIEREHCCDNVALQVCADRAVYVRALLSLASQGSPTAALSLSSHGGNFAGRVRAILSGHSVAQGSAQGRMAATLATLVVAVLPLALALATTTSSANSIPERVLRFPHNYSVGTLYGRWSDRSYRKVPWMPDHNEGWTVLGPAKGEVAIPENTNVKLTIGTTNLGFLRDLDPDALYYLDCRYKELRDEDIAPVATLTQLRALDLSDIGSLTGACLGKLGALENLEWLDFSRTPIGGYTSGSIAQFPNLKFFSGHLNDQADGILREVGDLTGIEFLCVKAATLTPEGLHHLNEKTTLRGLILDNVQLTDETLGALGAASNLLYLDLKKNPVTDEAVAMLNAFPRLTHLDLENTAITDAGVEYLVGNSTLEQIFLSNTNVTDACLEVLASLPSLQTIKLVETGVSEERAGAFALGIGARPGNKVAPQRSSNPDAPKVGLVMSHFTATGPHWISRPYGYSNQETEDSARALNEANYDVYAILEPGTAGLGELPGILHKHGLTTKVVDCSDANALAQLDVIYVCSLTNVQSGMLVALDSAIQAGTGLVNVATMGNVTPGDLNPMIERITGLERPTYTWGGFQESKCPVLVSHPILGNLKPGAMFTLNTLNGSRSESGVVRDATILLGTPANYPETYPVLYVRDHGKGRIVRAQWHRALQPGIPFPGFSFYVRCINWAAHRDVDVVW
jgi:Leucine-rich repeat (LRR) protein